MSRPGNRNQNGNEYKLEALEPRVMLSADPLSSVAGEFDAALCEDFVQLEESGPAPAAFNDPISYTTPSDNLFDFGADGGSPASAAAGEDQPAPTAAPVQEPDDDVVPRAAEQVVVQVVEEPSAGDQTAVLTLAVIAPISGPDILNSMAAQLTETLHSANGPPAQDVAGENVSVGAIASEATSARGAYSAAAGYSQFGNPLDGGGSTLSSLPISGSPVGSIADSSASEIVFIDRSLPDYEVLLQGVLASAGPNGSRQVFLLEPDRDGIEQITEILADQQGIAAVHILSHGSAASLTLGSGRLTADNLGQFGGQLRSWATALTAEADLLLYGCNVAAGDAGAAFVQRLGEITGADVAASTDPTGSSALGGDWVLEAPTGPIDASSLAVAGYGFALADIVGTDGNDKLVSNKAVDDILTGKKGDDTYVFQNYWGQDRVVERADEGTDTIDLSAVTDDITIALTAGGAIQPIHGIGPNSLSGVAGLDIVNFEIVKGGKGENTLDLSSYNGPLTVSITKASTWAFSSSNEVVVKAGDKTLLTVRNVTNIIGGQGDDVFVIRKGAGLKGYIDGGGGINTLNYAAYTSAVTVDLTRDVTSQPPDQTGFKCATNIRKGVKYIRNVIGGSGKNFLTGDDQDNILTGGKEHDELKGMKGNDTLRGLAGDDTLEGGLGADTLEGGEGDDTYTFKLADFADPLQKDTIVEGSGPKDGYLDTLDFSAFPANDVEAIALTFVVNSNSIQGSLKRGDLEKGSLFDPAAPNVERVFFSQGSNDFKLENDWVKHLLISLSSNNANRDGRVDLDCSAVPGDLLFAIGPAGKITASQAQPGGTGKLEPRGGGSTATAVNVRNLTGGQGNNRYLLQKGGQLLGKLTAGSPIQPPGKINLLDYYQFGQSVWANLSNMPVTFGTDVGLTELAGPAPVLPVQERWVYSIPLAQGFIVLKAGDEPFYFDCNQHTEELDEQIFKKAMAKVLERNDFTVEREYSQSGPTTRWTVTFAEPKDEEGLYNVLPGAFYSQFRPAGITATANHQTQTITLGKEANASDFRLLYNGSILALGADGNTTAANITSALNAAVNGNYTVSTKYASSADTHTWTVDIKPNAGVSDAPEVIGLEIVPSDKIKRISRSRSPLGLGMRAVDQSWDVYTNATGGRFKLTVSFNDKMNQPIQASTEGVYWNVAPDEIQNIIQKAILQEVNKRNPDGTPKFALDVVPKVLVSGMGTQTFPWRITFANMGRVRLDAPFNLKTLTRAREGMPGYWASGFSEGVENPVTGINKVIGSAEGDLIVGSDELRLSAGNVIRPIIEVRSQDMVFPADKHTLKLADLTISLQTGQPVLYRVVDGGSPIEGLTTETVYFVKVAKITEGADAGTYITFYPTSERDKPIQLYLPIGDAAHQLIEVFQADGGPGDDILIGYVAAPGGPADPHVNDRANALLGGEGEDVLVGSNGSDYLDGGRDSDSIYGDGSHDDAGDDGDGPDQGRDTVRGGPGIDSIYGYTGPDHLVGGSEGDFLVGGAGRDTVEGEAGNDTLAVIERGKATDYDLLFGGDGNDLYLFKGEWGVASLGEAGSNGLDTIDLSSSSQNYVYILSNGNLFAVPGILYNGADSSVIQVADTQGGSIRLGTALEELSGSKPSPGDVLTQWGFGFHQSVVGNANAVLTAYASPILPAGPFGAWLRVDRGDGSKVYDASIDTASTTAEELRDKLQAKLGSDLLVTLVGGTLLNKPKLQILATPSGARDEHGNIIPAKMDFTVKAPNSVAVGGEGNFENFEQINVSSGANTFVFGNDYWGGGNPAWAALQLLPIGDVIGRSLQGKLTVNTKDLHAKGSPLTLDFRAVNYELYFTFSPIKGDESAVQLTVRSVCDLEIPIVGLGANIRYNTIVFTHVDKNATIYGGRFKNTFNFDKGATYQGHLVGGKGTGVLTQFAGRLTDQVQIILKALQQGVLEASLPNFTSWDQFNLGSWDDLVRTFVFRVQNTLSYSNPGVGASTLGNFLNPKNLWTQVNLQRLKTQGAPRDAADWAIQAAQGNLFGPLIDTVWESTTGLSGLSENFKDVNPGEVIVRSGINLVRGRDYSWKDVADFKNNPTALLTSGADIISIGDNFFSATPGLHILAGGSGADTYTIRSQWWGGALILDDVQVEVGDRAANELLEDTLDFSAYTQDLYFSAFKLTLNDIDAIKSLPKSLGINFLPANPVDVGVSVVLVTPFKNEARGFADFFQQYSGVPWYKWNFAVAIGVENIKGGRGKNTFTFYDDARIGGKIEPGYGGSVSLDYADYHEGINVNLASKPPTGPSILGFIPLPDWVRSLFAFASKQPGAASGTAGLTQGHDVTGSAYDDIIKGSPVGNVLIGGPGADWIEGLDGNDTLKGNEGNDILKGGGGNDILYGGLGDDEIRGGSGNDTLYGDEGNDIIDGGDGSDTYYPSSSAVLVVLMGSSITDLPPGVSSIISSLGAAFTTAERDALSSIETIEINSGVSLPQDALFITQDGVKQTININPIDMKTVGTYHLYVDQEGTDIIDMKGYGASKVTFEPCSGEGSNTVQTLKIYKNSNKTAQDLILTLVIHGYGRAINERDLNFTPDKLLAGQFGNNTTPLTPAELASIAAVARSDWLTRSNNNSEVEVALAPEKLGFSISDLSGLQLANLSGDLTSGFTITIDVDAAGNGWSVDPAGPVPGKYDLLTALRHEIGHRLGVPHQSSPGLMDAVLDPGTREAITDACAAQIKPGLPQPGDAEGTPSDQQKMLDGLDAFATWAEGLGASLSASLADTIQLPFIEAPLNNLWSATAGLITSRIGQGIRQDILGVFQGDDEVTTDDFLALDSVGPAASHRLTEFEANIQLAGTGTNLTLNLDFLKNLGLDLTSFLKLTQSEPLRLEATLTLRFGFGLDSTTGEFYIEDPSLVASITLKHNKPLDVSLSVGPVGIGIEDGTIFFQAGIMLPAEGRYGVGSFSEFDIESPRFDPTSSYEITLPFELEGALAGLVDEVGRIYGSFNRGEDPGLNVENLTASQFFTMIPQTLNFDGPNFGALLDLTNVSLDQALEGIKTTLQKAIDPNGAAYQKLPFLNKSAVDLLGDGSVDVVQAVINGISVVQENLSDINHFEIDLNQALHQALGLAGIGGDEVDAAYDYLVSLSRSLTSQSTDDEIAVALAQKYHSAIFESLKLDRDVAAAYARLMGFCQKANPTDLEIAEKLADRDIPGRLAGLKLDRNMVRDYDGGLFMEHWVRLTKYGFNSQTTDAEIEALFDSTEAINLAIESRTVLDDPAATEDAKKAARTNLARLGIAEDATVDEINAALNRDAEIATAKADRNYVQEKFNSSPALQEAALALQALGLDGNASDLALATALVGVEKLAPWQADRDLVRDSGVVPAEALGRLQEQNLSKDSTDAEIARKLVTTAEFTEATDARDTLADYDAKKSIDLEYKDSVLDVRMRMAPPAIDGDYSLDFDLEDLPGLGGLLTSGDTFALDLDSVGKLHVDLEAQFDLNFTWDLSSLGDPKFIIYDNSQITFKKLEIRTLDPINITGSFLINSKPVLQLAIKDATIDVNLAGSISLVEDAADHKYLISELLSNLSPWNINLMGSVNATLPMYFPTETTPFGGSDQDENGDGYADNLLHVDGVFRGKNDFNLNFVTPEFDLSLLSQLFALLNDPENLLTGLDGMFEGVKDGLNSQFAAMVLPMAGDKLKEAAGFMDGLRDDLLGVVDDTKEVTDLARYDGSGLGHTLAEAVALNHDTDPNNDIKVIDLLVDAVKTALFEKLGGVLKVPVTDPVTGQVQYDEMGRVVYRPVTSKNDIQLTVTAKGIAFNVLFAGTIFETKVPLNFAAAIPGFELKSTGNIDLVLGYQFGLGFGFDCQAGLYVDTSGVTETGEELVLFLDVTIPANTELEATLFFLTAKLTSAADPDRPSGLFGSFSVDLKDKNGDGKWTLFKPWGSGSSDGLDIVARFKAEADVDLNLTVSVGGGTAFPSLSSIVSYEQVFADVQIGTGGATQAEFGGVPVIEFRDVKVNLGEFITSFVSPIVDKVSQVTDKVKPVIDVLTKPIGLLEKLGASRTSLLDIAKWLLPDQAASIQRAVDAIKDVIALVDAVKGFRDAAASEGGPIEINLGSFTVGGDPRVKDASGKTQTSIGATTSKSDPKSQVTGTDAKADAARNLVSKFGTTKGSFQFLLLTDPKSAFGLLLGKEVELFKYDLPALNLDFKYEQSFPIFPGLNAFLGGQVTATTNFSFGFNTRGFNQWKAQWNEEAHYYAPDKLYLLFNGFYLDDHVTLAADGKIIKDLPEVTLSASITAGAFVGVRGLVEAGVRGGVYATINFDLNDNPKAVPDTNPTPNSGHETAVGEYDGKMYGNEVLDRLKHGPQCLFDMSGKLTAGLEAYLWIGVKVWRWKITIFNKKFNLFTVVLADFDKACTVTTTGTGDQTQDPILAERAGDGTLTLNMGAERASYRIYGDTSDGNERFTIRQQDNKICVTYEGFTNEFTGVTRIVANGGGGDDEIIIEDSVTADVELHGGVGNDTLRMNGSGKARLYGDDGNDVLIGGPNDDYLDGGEGDDTLEGGGGHDELHGGNGNDSLKGGNGDDKLYGEDGDDVLYGEQGNDELYGGDGQDQVDGGDGNDTIYGDDETGLVGDNDTIIGGDGNDIIYAGPGDDVVNAGAFVPAGKTYTGTGDNDTVYGGPGNDELRGGPGNDKLYGEDGDDVLFGDEGADEVYGGSGSDRLNGGSGADLLLGEEGNDVVEWDSADEADIIIDGGSSDGDVLLLVGADSGEAITIGSAGDGSQNVRVHMGGITFAVAGVEVVGVKAGTGQDSVTVNDLSQTAVREVNVGFGAGLQQTFVVKTQEQQKISVQGSNNGTFTLSFGGQRTQPIPVNATAAQVADALAGLETLTLRDADGHVLDRYFEVAPAGGGETGWIVTFTGPLAGQDVQELLANWAAFATAGTIRDGGPANEVQTVTVTNATAGTFVLHYRDQETSPIAYNADAASVQAALEALAPIGEGNVIVTRLAADWRLEFVKDLAAQDIGALTADGSSLEGVGVTAAVTTLLDGGTIQDEAQAVTIGNPASGTFRLFYAGETTGEIPYNTSTETLRAELEKLSGIGSGNVAVTSSGGGTYTVVFQGGLAGTNVAQLIVTDSSLSTLASPAGAVIVTTLAQGAFETEENGDKKIETITGPDTSSDTLIINGSGSDDRFEIVVAKDANGADVLSVVQRLGDVLNVTFSISQMSDARLDKLSIQGLGGNDTFDLSGLTELPVVLEIVGGTGNDTMVGPALNNTWTLAENNQGSLGNANYALTFSSIEAITGGHSADTLTGPNTINTWTLNGNNSGNLNDALTFSSIETIKGGSTADTLVGPAGTNVWTLAQDNAGNLNSALTFSSIETITGGTGLDILLGLTRTNVWTLTETNTGNLNGLLAFSSIEEIVGGAETDTVLGPNVTNTWKLSGNNAGILNEALTFSSIEVITGGSGVDTLIGPAINNLWRLTQNNAGDLNNNALEFSSIEVITGGTATDTLLGPDTANSWTLTGRNAGDLNGALAFSQIENLVGGAGNDKFVFADGAAVDGMINGSGGVNQLDYSAYTMSVVVDLLAGEATGTAGIRNFRDVRGGAVDDFLAGDGQNNVLEGLAGNDILVGRGGSDSIFGGRGDDVIVGDHANLAPVRTVWFGGCAPASTLVPLGGNFGDALDGEEGRDLIFGDSVLLNRTVNLGNAANPRFRALSGLLIYGTDGNTMVTGLWQPDPTGTPAWSGFTITLVGGLNESVNDYIAGGPGDDMIFGQEGDDTIQGDGSTDLSLTGSAPVGAYRDSSNLLHLNPSFEAATDGDDYIEGGPGNDVIFGNLGQDDIIGGSSSLFGLTAPGQRADGSDLIFGGAGTDISRNNPGDTLDRLNDPNSTGVHGRDSDAIVGDNGNIYRLVGTAGYLAFNYDDYDPVVKIVPRAIELLDYTPGGWGYDPVRAASDIGAADEIHGESGDDFIYGMKGNDVLFGDGQDDDLVGGYGNDWISGGTGEDGVLGDDGRIFTSRNTTSYGEPLYGIPALSATNTTISVPGKILFTTINLNGQLKKTADLEPFYETNSVLPSQYPAGLKDDVIYGGLGNDFLHGQEGDDAISGAEALPEFFNAPVNNGNRLNFGGFGVAKGYRDPAEFADFDQYNPMKEIAGFLLNFETTVNGVKVDDGRDSLFGDTGNDWLVGGTNADFLFGGWGSDLLDADDHKGTAGGLNNVPDASAFADPDIAYGGAGRDVLIANTGGDRLIDWVGQFNTHLVPITSFGAPTVIRAIQPQLPEYLCALARSLGADQTRVSPDYGTGAGYGEAARYGEPYGELGLVTQHDKGFWKDQVGGADGLLAGTVLGTQRDVRFAETFTPGSLEAFAPTAGTWKSANGVYLASPGRGVEAVSLMLYADYLPSYAEVLATVNANQAKAGFKSNAYIVFDYQDATNFKFAGIDVGLNKLRIGQHSAEGWTYLAQGNMILLSETNYGLKLVLNGDTATLIVNGVKALTYTFGAALNGGMLGLGTDNATSRFDDVRLLVLPPSVTQSVTEDFSGDTTGAFSPVVGAWGLTGGACQAAPEFGGDAAISTLSSSLLAGTGSQLQVTVSTQSFGGMVFDYQDPLNFKFAGIMAGTNQVIIGHRTASGWYFDEVVTQTIKAGAAYNLGVLIQGSSVSVSLNGQRVAGHTYAGSFLEDGNAGLFSLKGSSLFDDASMQATLL